MSELDLNKIYLIVGALIVTNIGAIGSVIWASLKLTWWLSAFKTTTELGIKQNTEDVNAAHAKIRDVQNHLMNGRAD